MEMPDTIILNEVDEVPPRRKPRKPWKNPLYTRPSRAKLTLSCGKRSISWTLRLAEAAWLASQLCEILKPAHEEGEFRRLFRLGEKLTFARYECGRLSVALQPVWED